VGETPVAGLFVANGLSGHGFKLAPAIGSLIAQAIAGERTSFDTEVDPTFLSFDRAPIRLESKSVLA
jgi:glycine/D-amino acid oxidase-like deaminating enzyme